MLITKLQLKKAGVRDNELNLYYPYIYEFSLKYNINTIQRIQALFSNILYESNFLKSMLENLNYKTPNNLLKIFPKYFNKNNVHLYLNNPEKLANKVYANRMGNGNEESGDGWKHRGIGPLQLTGKNNHLAFGKSIGVDFIQNPDLLRTPKYMIESAFWYWESNKLNLRADKITLAKTDKEKTELYKSIGSYINRGTFSGTPIGWVDRDNIRKKLEQYL